MAFKYQKRDASAWEQRANQRGNDFINITSDDYQTYTTEKGDNWVRFLPPTWEDAPHYGLDVWVHYNVGPDRGQVLCSLKMKGDPCPICEAHARASRAGDDELKRELAAGKRVLVWMLNLKDEKKGPMLWAMPWTLDAAITKVCKDPRTGALYMIDDPEDGYGVSFERTGEQLTTKYTGIQIDRKPSSVDPDFIEFVVEVPLPTTLVWMSYDQIQKLFEGGGHDAPAGKQPEHDTKRDERRDDRREEPRREEARQEEKPNTGFRRRGETRQEEQAANDQRASPDDDPRREARGNGAGNGADPREEAPAADDRRADDSAPSGKTKAQELRERFARR